MAEPVVLSGSSLNTFLRCALQWEYAYVRRLQRPPSLKAALGIAGHAAAELDLAQKMDTKVDLPKDVITDAFRDHFHEEAADAEEKPDKKETRPIMLDSGIAAIGKWYDAVAPLIQPIQVEQHGQFSINGQPYDWTNDAVDIHETIHDWKFVGRKPDRGQEYVLNMVGYAIGYRRLTGSIEKSVQLDHIVRTKEPQYIPIESDGPVTDDDIYSFAGIVKTVMRSIDAGIFPPTGLKSNACSWCGYWDICPAYRSERGRKRRT